MPETGLHVVAMVMLIVILASYKGICLSLVLILIYTIIPLYLVLNPQQYGPSPVMLINMLYLFIFLN